MGKWEIGGHGIGILSIWESGIGSLGIGKSEIGGSECTSETGISTYREFGIGDWEIEIPRIGDWVMGDRGIGN